MKILTAKVTKPARVVQTKYGERFALDLTIDGQPETIWGPSHSVPCQRPGEWVTLGRDSKGKLHLIEGDDTPVTQTTAANSPQTGMTPETKKAIAAYVEEMGSLYGFCYQTAQTKLPDAPNEAKQAMASSLFIAAQRKFGLA